MNNFIVSCPHCQKFIIIEFINCAIFRHAYYIASNTQIDPHTSEAECKRLKEEKLIVGCGGPFRIDLSSGKPIAVVCDYI
jgi:hypothetical protein